MKRKTRINRNQRVASRNRSRTSIALEDEGTCGHQPNTSTFGAATTAPILRRNQRQLLFAPEVFRVDVSDCEFSFNNYFLYRFTFLVLKIS